MNIQYKVKVTEPAMAEMSQFTWGESDFATFCNEELEKQGAPHVERGFFLPRTWLRLIMEKYTSVVRTQDPVDNSVTFIFRLEDNEEASHEEA